MANNYKIRLRRFNGIDYDILNLSSDNIIMSNGDNLENAFQSLFPSSNEIISVSLIFKLLAKVSVVSLLSVLSFIILSLNSISYAPSKFELLYRFQI
jgi:hypothetical protein